MAIDRKYIEIIKALRDEDSLLDKNTIIQMLEDSMGESDKYLDESLRATLDAIVGEKV